MSSRFIKGIAALGLVAIVAAVAGAAHAREEADIYTVHALVSDGAAVAAPGTDASLVNGWGLSAGPTTPWWAANNGTNTSTLYNGAGAKQALTVAVAGAPTGTVFNGSAADFVISSNGKSGAARFLFATEGGTILGWSPTVNATTAVTAVDRSSSGAIYKGLATLATSCTRRTSTTGGSTCSTPRSTSSRVDSPTRGSRRGMRRSASRRSAATSSSPTRSRTPRRRTTSLRPARDTSTSTRPPAR